MIGNIKVNDTVYRQVTNQRNGQFERYQVVFEKYCQGSRAMVFDTRKLEDIRVNKDELFLNQEGDI